MPEKPTKKQIAEAKRIFASLGGSATSAAKTAACRANASLPRPNGRKPRRPRKRQMKGKPAKRSKPVR